MYKLLLIINLFLCSSNYAGVVLVADVPDNLKQLIKQAQKEVDYFCCNNPDFCKQYLFEKATYDPHISLSYVSKDKISLSGLKAKDSLLESDLHQLMARTQPINLSHSFNNLEIELLRGKNPRSYAGTQYNNFIIFIIKIAVTPELMALVNSIDKTLEGHEIASPRRLPFNAHVTIGWIYDKDDSDPEPLGQKLKEKIDHLVERFNNSHQQFIIDRVVLSTNQGQQTFALAHKTRTSNAFQTDHSRPCARPSRPGCSYCPTSYTRVQNACPRSK